MVLFFNLQNFYESFYDVFNQYYVYFGGQKYVDFGLGIYCVKCWVYFNFCLIVIEEKDVVYKYFFIFFINWLEKYYLDINMVLEKWQKSIVEEFCVWVEKFINVKVYYFQKRYKYSFFDVFIGYYLDVCVFVVLQVIERQGFWVLMEEFYQKVFEEVKLILLNCVMFDVVVWLSVYLLGGFVVEWLLQEYFYRQRYNFFVDFFQVYLYMVDLECYVIFIEIIIFFRLLISYDCEILELEVIGRVLKFIFLWLQQFDIEYLFFKEV